MKIYRKFVDEIDKVEVSKKYFLEYTENNGYYKKGGALATLKAIGILRTPFAIYTTK